jgi:general secretion pathway protein G
VKGKTEVIHRDVRAFTLIELLIVVAIIAILAAIAVPNFLEAQTRAKVSRCKADMRSITTAIEAYHIDNNRYPGPFEAHDQANWTDSLNEPPFHSRIGSVVTTPIAYMTSLPTDPFSALENYLTDPPWTNGSDLQISMRFVYYNYDYYDSISFSSSMGYLAARAAAGKWLLYSPGPDRDWYNDMNGVYISYDSTNGTVSLGNLFRTQRDSGGFDQATFQANL